MKKQIARKLEPQEEALLRNHLVQEWEIFVVMASVSPGKLACLNRHGENVKPL